MGGHTIRHAVLDTQGSGSVEIAFDTPLADYVSPEEHETHASAAQMVARYHEFKARAVRARLTGNLELAYGFEQKCEALRTAFRAIICGKTDASGDPRPQE